MRLSARFDSHVTDADLASLIDDELDAGRRAAAAAHLARCAPCRERHARLVRGAAHLSRVSPATGRDHDAIDRARARLVARLHEPSIALQPASVATAASVAGRYVAIAASLAALLLLGPALADSGLLPIRQSAAPGSGLLPARAITPGAVETVTAGELCSGGVTATRTVSTDDRDAVLRAYHMTGAPAAAYELDFLVTPELGGASDRRNLWPQRYATGPWNAYVKDDLERLLPELVCAGRLDLAQAQRDIATDWIAAYRKYFGVDQPLPRQTAEAAADDDEVLVRDVAVTPPSGRDVVVLAPEPRLLLAAFP